MNYTPEQIANALDLAVLKPNATRDDVECACALANKHHIRSVCVSPIYVPLAASLYYTSCVIGFPHGNSKPDTKYRESVTAIHDGTRELDIVINYGRYLDGDSVPMQTELALIVSAAHQSGVQVKAILETCFYTFPQIREACRICVDSNVDFVKTSTGFGPKGAGYIAIATMLDAVKGTDVEVKASGGISCYYHARYFLAMGCTRIGSSKFLELLP